VILDAMTPETATTCHYFWASARDYRREDREFDDFIRRITIVAFNEDKDMLEAEQKIVDLAPKAPQVDVAGDTGGLQARRIFSRLLAEENARQAAE
jgi:vanillate O-demethylase monooxygenase subunit